MIAVRSFHGDESKEEIDPADISDLAADHGCLLWVDVVDPSEEELTCLADEFSLHPLAMEDVRKHQQRPKLEQYPDHAFLVAYSAGLQEVDFFVGPTWVLSVRERDSDGDVWDVESAKTRFERTRGEDTTVGFLVYVLLDELVDGYFGATDESEDALEKLEEHIFAEQLPDEGSVQRQLFDARRRLLLFRRAVVPLREVLGALLRKEVEWLEEETLIHFQDVYDHVLRAIDQVDGQRELLNNAVDAHLAIISNRMNHVMKKMTSWGAILLGSTLVAGIYGMNFEHMPELKWKYGYIWALGIMAGLTVVGYRYFRGKDWL